MKNNILEEQKYIKAKSRVQKVKGFYTHLTIYFIVMPLIIFTNLNFEPHFHWFWFSLIGWGIGLFTHWLNVFGFSKIGLGKEWEDRKIKEMMNNERINKEY